MITVNLLPKEYRSTKKKNLATPYIPLAVLFGALFIILTLFFYVDYLTTKSAYDGVYKQWLQLNPQMKALKALENKVEIEMRGEKEFLERYVLNTEPLTQILQLVSEHLPPRAWLTDLKIEHENDETRLVLQGVVLAFRGQSGIEQVEEYIGDLKEALPKGDITLSTAKQQDKDSTGTTFTATFEWGGQEQ